MRRIAALSCVLAFACAAPAAAAEGVVPVEGKWHATTSAGLPIAFEVSGGQLLNARFRFRWGFCGSFESATTAGVPIELDGHWKYVDSRGPFAEGAFVAPDRAEGTVVAPSRQLPGCPETKATFVATPGEAPFERAEAVVQDNVRTRHLSASPSTMVLAGGRRVPRRQPHRLGGSAHLLRIALALPRSDRPRLDHRPGWRSQGRDADDHRNRHAIGPGSAAQTFAGPIECPAHSGLALEKPEGGEEMKEAAQAATHATATL